MKTRILSFMLVLVLLLSAFAGCGGETETAQEPGTGGKPAQNTNGEETAEPEPDYSWFAFPEPTDNLVIYTDPYYDQELKEAAELFREQYPDVSLDYKIFGEDELTAKLRAEIPAGGGPDLVYADLYSFPDIFKTVSTGVFTDLDPYLHADPEFSFADYNTAVLDGGVYEDRRCIVPIEYEIPIVLTTEEVLGAIGSSAEDLGTFDGFLNACESFYQTGGKKIYLFSYGASQKYQQNLYLYSGLSLIDYERHTVGAHREIYEKILEVSALYGKNPTTELISQPQPHGWLIQQKCLFLNHYPTILLLFNYYAFLKNNGVSPVLAVLPAYDDGTAAQIKTYAAIPVSSENPLNAYRFLKILLSDDFQCPPSHPDFGPLQLGLPVKNSSMERLLSVQRTRYGIGEEITDRILERIGSISHSSSFPPVLYRYYRDEMLPYIQGKKDFDECFDKLMNVLELYIDE